VSDIYQELQPFGGDIKKWREVKLEKNLPLLTSPLLPPQLFGKKEAKSTPLTDFENKELFLLGRKLLREWNNVWDKKNKVEKENYDIEEFDYKELHFNQWKKTNSPTPKQLPFRLYNLKDNQIESTEGQEGRYAILSYVWGSGETSEKVKEELDKVWGSSNLGFKNEVRGLGYKSWKKAIQALETINKEKHRELIKKQNPKITDEELEKELKNFQTSDTHINYLWMDQLCINQAESSEETIKEMNQEVSKMRQYYSNAEITLIAMDSKIDDTSDVMEVLAKVVNSEWFTRSWTFQEGWLSKHTIFMFDDKLVDGWAMAGNWVLHQPSYIDGGKYLSWYEFNQGTKKIATPVGWVYYRDGYDSEKDKVEMTLIQALKEIKNRGRSIPIDGVYSILGLLPYGEQVKTQYKKFGEKYSQSELEEALYEVMKVAIKNGYAEPLAWHGVSNSSAGLCCLPQIDKYGSTSVVGCVGKVGSMHKEIDGSINQLITFTNQGLHLTGIPPHYIIQQDQSNTHKLERGFEIEGGLYRKEVIVRPRNTEQEIKASLLGTKETLAKTAKDNILVVLYKEFFGTNKLFAILVKETNQADVYHRLGLVELVNSEEIKKIAKETFNDSGKKTIIGLNNSEVQPEPQLQAQIELTTQKK